MNVKSISSTFDVTAPLLCRGDDINAPDLAVGTVG
jgi:hypothetical protein